MTRARQWSEAALAVTAIGLARVVPRRVLHGFGRLVGAALGRVDARHTGIARDNLHRALGGGLEDAARERILRACWRHFGGITLDALAFRDVAREAAAGRLVLRGEEHVSKAYAAGKGVLFVSAHFGDWEAGALLLGHLGYELSVVARPLDNPLLDRMLDRLRRRTGNGVFPKRRAVREILKAMGRGGGVAILIDQDARGDGLFVPFFGRPASTTPTAALVALRTGAALIPMAARVEPDGTIAVCAEAAIALEPTDDRDGDVRRLTAACTAIVEGWVRRDP